LDGGIDHIKYQLPHSDYLFRDSLRRKVNTQDFLHLEYEKKWLPIINNSYLCCCSQTNKICKKKQMFIFEYLIETGMLTKLRADADTEEICIQF